MFTADDMTYAAARARRAVLLAALGAVVTTLAYWNYGDLDNLAGVLTILVFASFFVLVLAGVRWLQWFHTVYAEAERHGRARFTGPWWWLGWLIPGANLVLPKMMVNDVWWSADPLGVRRPRPRAIQVWWVLWAGSQFLNLPGLPDDGSVGVLLNGLAMLAYTASTPSALKTIRLLTERAVRLSYVPVAPAAAEALAR